MTEADEPPAAFGSPAEADATLANKLRSLRNIETAIGDMIAAENEAAARQLDRIAREHARQALEAALACAARPPSVRARFSLEDIRHAEERLGIEPDTFTSFFAVNFGQDAARRKALGELLVEARAELAQTPVDKPFRETPSWLPAVIRIGSAVLVGAAVGAPLAALAVGEPVVTEIAKAGISVAACAFAAEVTNQLVQRWLGPPVPVEPPAPRTRSWLPRAEPVGPAAALPAPAERPAQEPVAAAPKPDLVDLAVLVRRGQALPDSLERHPALPAEDTIVEPADLELAVPDEIEPPAPPPPPPIPPPPPPPTRRIAEPFSGFDL